MQVELLPAAPLPGGVKVARRSVKPFVLVRVQVWQPISGCNVSSRRAFARGHHLGRRRVPAHGHQGASPVTLTISGRQAYTSWLHLSRKQDRFKHEVAALPTPSAILAVCQHLTATLNERKSYATSYPLPKPVALSQELQTKSCHPNPTGRETEPGVPSLARWS